MTSILCTEYNIIIIYFLYGSPFKHLWSLSKVHVQYILPVNEPSLEDDRLRAMARERGEKERDSERVGEGEGQRQ